jgi:hypothetical protein
MLFWATGVCADSTFDSVAATVYLTDGSAVSGMITGATETTVTVTTPTATLTIQNTDIARIDYSSPKAVASGATAAPSAPANQYFSTPQVFRIVEYQNGFALEFGIAPANQYFSAPQLFHIVEYRNGFGLEFGLAPAISPDPSSSKANASPWWFSPKD